MAAAALATLVLPAVSLEYVYLSGIQAFDPASPDHATDPTTLPVQVAFLPVGTEPGEPDWHDAEWVSPTSARILVGPTAVELDRGYYLIWLRVTGATEQPERVVGALSVQ